MSGSDPVQEFGRLLKQVKHQEYERGWREAMEAIQKAVVTLYRNVEQAPADDEEVPQGAPPQAEPARNEARAEPAVGQETETGGDGQSRFVTPKWALLKR